MNAQRQEVVPATFSFTPVPSGLLQRKCACGNHTTSGGECAECNKKQQTLQRASHFPLARGTEGEGEVPPIVHKALRSPGEQLNTTTRAFFEPRFGYDSQVRVHADPKAEESARAVEALAYTVGNDMVFAESQYTPNTTEGLRLIAHELSHVMQQNSASTGGQLQGELTINHPDDAFEQEADAVARRVMTGASADGSLTLSRLTIKRQTSERDTEKKPPEKKEASEVVVEGLKTVAEQAKDNNPQVKRVIIDPIKDRLKGEWNRLGAGEKAATVSLGAATLGMAGGALLSDPRGRKQLEGVNLAAPFTLIPYMPLSSFKYTLASGDSTWRGR